MIEGVKELIVKKLPGNLLAIVTVVGLFLLYEKVEHQTWTTQLKEIHDNDISVLREYADKAQQAIDRNTNAIVSQAAILNRNGDLMLKLADSDVKILANQERFALIYERMTNLILRLEDKNPQPPARERDR